MTYDWKNWSHVLLYLRIWFQYLYQTSMLNIDTTQTSIPKMQYNTLYHWQVPAPKTMTAREEGNVIFNHQKLVNIYNRVPTSTIYLLLKGLNALECLILDSARIPFYMVFTKWHLGQMVLVKLSIRIIFWSPLLCQFLDICLKEGQPNLTWHNLT